MIQIGLKNELKLENKSRIGKIKYGYREKGINFYSIVELQIWTNYRLSCGHSSLGWVAQATQGHRHGLLLSTQAPRSNRAACALLQILTSVPGIRITMWLSAASLRRRVCYNFCRWIRVVDENDSWIKSADIILNWAELPTSGAWGNSRLEDRSLCLSIAVRAFLTSLYIDAAVEHCVPIRLECRNCSYVLWSFIKSGYRCSFTIICSFIYAIN